MVESNNEYQCSESSASKVITRNSLVSYYDNVGRQASLVMTLVDED